MVEGHYDDGRLLLENMKMPVLFIGHGSPMNAIEENEFSLAWGDSAQAQGGVVRFSPLGDEG